MDFFFFFDANIYCFHKFLSHYFFTFYFVFIVINCTICFLHFTVRDDLPTHNIKYNHVHEGLKCSITWFKGSNSNRPRKLVGGS